MRFLYRLFLLLGGLILICAVVPLLFVAFFELRNTFTNLMPLQVNAPVEYVDVDRNDYGSILWLSNGRIFTNIDWQVYEIVNGRLLPVLLEKTEGCRLVRHYALEELPDGRLGMVEGCLREVASNDSYRIIAYDGETRTVETLVPDTTSGRFSFRPDMERGVQAVGNLMATIHWLTPTGRVPMEIVIDSDTASWSLARNFDYKDTSIDTGIARSPVWSPDGKRIAFFANAEAAGSAGPSRLYGEYTLYFLDMETEELVSAFSGFDSASMLHWSPDGQWLVFRGKKNNSLHTSSELWLYSPSTGRFHLIAQVRSVDISWSPDGKKLMAVVCEPDICIDEDGSEFEGKRAIVVYDLTDLLVDEVR